jgi:hypothetical protein
MIPPDCSKKKNILFAIYDASYIARPRGPIITLTRAFSVSLKSDLTIRTISKQAYLAGRKTMEALNAVLL